MDLEPGAGDPFEAYWPKADAYRRHRGEVSQNADTEKRRHPDPAPEGIQDIIVKDARYGNVGCYDTACRLLDPRTKKPVGLKLQRKYEGRTDGSVSDWCVGAAGMDEHGFPKYFTTFDECCLAHQNRELGSTSSGGSKMCDKLWGIDYTYYTNQQDFTQTPPNR